MLGDNATEIERQAAEEIKNFLLESGSSYIKVIDLQEIESFKRGYNLVIIGTPKTNPLLEEVYAMTNVTRVTEEFPGEGKGVLEILGNPWDEKKAMLLVEGNTKSISDVLVKEIAKEVRTNVVVVEFYEDKITLTGIRTLQENEAIKIAEAYLKKQGFNNLKVNNTLYVNSGGDYCIKTKPFKPSFPWDPTAPLLENATIRKNYRWNISKNIPLWCVEFVYYRDNSPRNLWVCIDAKLGKVIGEIGNVMILGGGDNEGEMR